MNAKVLYHFLTALLVTVLLGACTARLPQPGDAEPVVPPTGGTSVPTQAEVLPTAEPTLEPIKTEAPVSWVAYIGVDGNVWLVDWSNKTQVQVTRDAAGYPTTPDQTPVVIYQRPQWSPDGSLLAYERQDGTPDNSGFTFQYSLWIYDLASGQTRIILQGNQVAGFAWKPGTHLLALGEALDPHYFGMNGHDPAYAKGLRQLDVDTGAVTDLVQPERGYHLVGPEWSPDGRFISFKEVYLNEGSGMFAIYDTVNQSYHAWDKAIGNYTWSRDSESIVYDDLTYIPQGIESIYTQPRLGGEAQPMLPSLENAYAYYPVYAPGSDSLAYLVDYDGIDGFNSTLFFMEGPGKEPSPLGRFYNVTSLSWTSGWAHVLISQGPYENPEILMISPSDGSLTVLAHGSQPDWNPASLVQ